MNGRPPTHLPNLFFGITGTITGAIVAGGTVGEWWAFAILIPAGAYGGWKAGRTL